MHEVTQAAFDATTDLTQRLAWYNREFRSIARNICSAEQLRDEPTASLLGATSRSGEAAVVKQLLHFMRYPSVEMPLDGLPIDPDDTLVLEYALKIGRADMVIFHIDGSASVIEVKDGTTGYRSVVAGIGQASLYACQLAAVKGSLKEVRRVLAWSALRNSNEDSAVKEACKMAGVLPIRLFDTNKLIKAFADDLEQHIDYLCPPSGDAE